MTKNIKLPAALLSGVIIGAVAFTAVGVSAHRGDLTDEERAERRLEIQEKKTERLQEKVDEGIITEEQRSQIEAWFDERLAEREASQEDRLSKEEFQALSEEEQDAIKNQKQAEREARKIEAEEFFDSIGVDKEELFDGESKGFGKRDHKHRQGSSSVENVTSEVEPATVQVQ